MSTDVWQSETETFVSDDGGVEKTQSGPNHTQTYYKCRCVNREGDSQDSDSAFM